MHRVDLVGFVDKINAMNLCVVLLSLWLFLFLSYYVEYSAHLSAAANNKSWPGPNPNAAFRQNALPSSARNEENEREKAWQHREGSN